MHRVDDINLYTAEPTVMDVLPCPHICACAGTTDGSRINQSLVKTEVIGSWGGTGRSWASRAGAQICLILEPQGSSVRVRRDNPAGTESKVTSDDIKMQKRV